MNLLGWLPATRSDHRALLEMLNWLLGSARRQEEMLVSVQDEIRAMAEQASTTAERLRGAVENVRADIGRLEEDLSVDLSPLRESLAEVGAAADSLQSLADQRPETTPEQPVDPAPPVDATPVEPVPPADPGEQPNT